jgi:hypothetical protein
MKLQTSKAPAKYSFLIHFRMPLYPDIRLGSCLDLESEQFQPGQTVDRERNQWHRVVCKVSSEGDDFPYLFSNLKIPYGVAA